MEEVVEAVEAKVEDVVSRCRAGCFVVGGEVCGVTIDAESDG